MKWSPNKIYSAQKKVILEYFSREWIYWQDVYSNKVQTKDLFHKYEMQKRKKHVLSLLQSTTAPKGITVHDVGCGTGVIMEEIDGINNYIIGIDLSHKMLQEAKKRIESNKVNLFGFVRCDAENLPFKDKIFDAIVGMGLMEYLQDREGFYTETGRVIAEKGIIILTFPNMFKLKSILDPNTYASRLLRFIQLRLIHSKKNIYRKNYNPFLNEDFSSNKFTLSKIKKETKAMEYNIEKIICLGFGPFTIWKKRIFPDRISIEICALIEKACKIFYPLNVIANRWVISFVLDRNYQRSDKF